MAICGCLGAAALHSPGPILLLLGVSGGVVAARARPLATSDLPGNDEAARALLRRLPTDTLFREWRRTEDGGGRLEDESAIGRVRVRALLMDEMYRRDAAGTDRWLIEGYHQPPDGYVCRWSGQTSHDLWVSSGDVLILGVVGPGGGLVVEGSGLQAAMQDADQPVAELAQGGVVAGAAGTEGVVVGAGAR